jgi:hypothetical protein
MPLDVHDMLLRVITIEGLAADCTQARELVKRYGCKPFIGGQRIHTR